MLILNMHSRVAELNRKTKVFARAKQLLETAHYEAAEKPQSLTNKGFSPQYSYLINGLWW